MAKKPTPKDGPHKLRPDTAETAFRVMLEATGQAPKTVPGNGTNPEAAERGSKGGKKGGKRRARALSKADRSTIAKRAAEARWRKDSA